MLEKFLRHFQFLLKSTNQHGVHSPFVYSYLTEGIYETKKSYKGFQKNRRLLQATISYFNVKNIIGKPEFSIYPSNERITPTGKNTYANLRYINSISLYNKLEIKQLIKSIDDATIFYIDSPNNSDKAIENWLALIESNNIHVSIDFFHAGLLFTRKEQRKEHFTLRV